MILRVFDGGVDVDDGAGHFEGHNYGLTSTTVALKFLGAIMGSLEWIVGFKAPVCEHLDVYYNSKSLRFAAAGALPVPFSFSPLA